MPDYSVPEWLRPPSEAERQRLDQLTAAAQQKAGVMIRKAVGMRRMQADAAEAIKNGVDPEVAKKNALFNNADLLFGDNPEAYSRVTNREEVNAIKEAAQTQLNAHRERMDLRLSAKEAEIERAHQAAEVLRQNNLISQDDKRKADIENAKNRSLLELYKAQNEVQKSDADREARIQKAESDRALRESGQKASQRRGQLADLHRQLAATTAQIYKTYPITPKDSADVRHQRQNLQVERAQIQEKIDKLLKEGASSEDDTLDQQAGDNNMPDVPTPAPSGNKRLRWTPEGLVPVQ